MFLLKECLVRYCPLLNKGTMTAPVAFPPAPEKRCLQPLAKLIVEEADRATRHHCPHDGIVVGILVCNSETSEELHDLLKLIHTTDPVPLRPRTSIYLRRFYLMYAVILSLNSLSLLQITAEAVSPFDLFCLMFLYQILTAGLAF